MLRLVRQVAAPVGRHTTLIGRDRHMAAPGAKYAVCDCILFVIVVIFHSDVNKDWTRKDQDNDQLFMNEDKDKD